MLNKGVRFSPTGVGNIRPCHHQSFYSPVQPHGRGEHLSLPDEVDPQVGRQRTDSWKLVTGLKFSAGDLRFDLVHDLLIDGQIRTKVKMEAFAEGWELVGIHNQNCIIV